MATATTADGIDIYFEHFGSTDDPLVVLVPGLGAQLLAFPEEFCLGLVDRYFQVVRMDNRDAGLSTLLTGRPDDGSAYTLSDMAADVVAVIDAIGDESAHVVGVSMGGMIAQTVAIEHRDRCRSLSSVSSSTGNYAVAAPAEHVAAALNAGPVEGDIDVRIEHDLASRRLWSSPNWHDDDAVRAYFRDCYERSAQGPDEQARQMAAIRAAGVRDEAVAAISVPTLILHGTEDTLIPPAAASHFHSLLPEAELVLIDDMGHDLPVQAWAAIINAITNVAARSYI